MSLEKCGANCHDIKMLAEQMAHQKNVGGTNA
jgi:hypothetical protein